MSYYLTWELFIFNLLFTVNLFILEFELKRGFVMDILPTQSTAWSLAFQIKPFRISNDLTGILHVSEKGGNTTEYGARNPQIIFYPNSTKLEVTSSVNGAFNHHFHLCDKSLPLFVYTEVSIVQSYVKDGKYLTTVKINGTTCQEVSNTDAREFHNVKIHSSSPFYEAAKAQIKGYQLKNLPNGMILSSK